jgi:hypothetical protein
MVFYFTLLERLFPVLSGFTTETGMAPKVALQNLPMDTLKVVDSKSIGISIKAAGAL